MTRAPCSATAVFLLSRAGPGGPLCLRATPCVPVSIYAQRALTIRNRPILGTLIAYGVAAAAQLVTLPNIAVELAPNAHVQTVLAYEDTAAPVPHYENTEQAVRTYFADTPILIRIAWCESEFHQTDPVTGKLIRGVVNPADVGVMQINEHYHGATATSMGIDLHDLYGNMKYARFLYREEGTAPWNASRACWQNPSLAMR